MRILVTGNLGYLGPCVARRLRETRPAARLVGLDSGFYADCLTVPAGGDRLGRVHEQLLGDVRALPAACLDGADAVVHLAAISNDPIGNAYEQVTLEINHRATVELARRARAAGARSFVFASSCSVYGAADGPRTEDSEVAPLTAYARSKILAERDLAELADDSFVVTCLRFATACGMSDRLRLDLVLNDFVAAAVATRRITLLSDGSAWRPLIDVQDMARAIDWAVDREPGAGEAFLVVNAGSDEGNYRIRDLAEAVRAEMAGVDVTFGDDAAPDPRSYRVDFSRFRALAPDHQPRVDLRATVGELHSGLARIAFADANFRDSSLVRLRVLESLRSRRLLTDRLEWAA